MRHTVALSILLVSVWPAVAQDMPLSQILIDGEGWRPTSPVLEPTASTSVRTRAGNTYVCGTAEHAVYLLTPAGARRVVAEGLAAPSAVTLTPDEGTLIVADAAGKYLRAYRIEPNGDLSAGERYYTLRVRPGQPRSDAAGLCVDTAGRVYATTNQGVQVFDPTGRLSGVLVPPAAAPLTAIGFGGGENDGLYVKCGTTVYVRRTRARGLSFPQRQAVLLWPQGAPGAAGTQSEDQPSLTVFPAPAEKANGTGVVICPGGGYGFLAADHEGKQVAEWFNTKGVTAFVLKYRLAPRYRHPAPLSDAQRALRLVRSQASQWHVDPKRVGIMGFSAGGHLASTAGTHFDAGKADATDPVDRASCRPDFLILCYPVITLEPPFAHMGSRNNLLGRDATDPRAVEYLCNDRQVTAQTPPTFLFHTDADSGVVPENSALFYLALKKHKIPAELHIYEKGPHGVGLAQRDPILGTWPDRLAGWLQGRGLLKKD